MTACGQAGQSGAVVQVRVLGEVKDIDALAAALAASPAVEVIHRSGPRVNRRDPGVRVYLTLRVSKEAQR